MKKLIKQEAAQLHESFVKNSKIIDELYEYCREVLKVPDSSLDELKSASFHCIAAAQNVQKFIYRTARFADVDLGERKELSVVELLEQYAESGGFFVPKFVEGVEDMLRMTTGYEPGTTCKIVAIDGNGVILGCEAFGSTIFTMYMNFDLIEKISAV